MYKAQYKILIRTYLMIIVGILVFVAYVFIKNKTLFNINNLILKDYKVLIVLIMSAVTYLLSTFLYQKRINKIKAYKGLVKKRVNMYIDIMILKLFLYEFIVLINLSFFIMSKNIIFFIFAVIIVLLIVINIPKKNIFKNKSFLQNDNKY